MKGERAWRVPADAETFPIFRGGRLVGNAIRLGRRFRFFAVSGDAEELNGQVFDSVAALESAVTRRTGESADGPPRTSDP